MNINTCSCCREIWNSTNLNTVNLGKHKLFLCSDCYKEFKKFVKQVCEDGQKNLSIELFSIGGFISCNC